MTNSIAEIEDAACIFIIGSNTSVAHPLIARRVLRAREKGARLIVADVLAPGLTPLKTLIDSLVANGGKILVCMPCIEERKISQADLIQGSELIKAGRLVVEMTSAKSTAVY